MTIIKQMLQNYKINNLEDKRMHLKKLCGRLLFLDYQERF